MTITQIMGFIVPTVLIFIPALILIAATGLHEDRERFKREHPRPRFL